MKKPIFLKTWGIVLGAAMTAILIAMAACKGTPTTPTTPYVDTFGDLVGTFNGVDAYSNGWSANKSGIDNYYNGSVTGKKWLCGEYVRRYYLQIYDFYINTLNYDGTAASFYMLAGSLVGMSAYPNGGSVAPQVGDILCDASHVAIIREVGSNYVNVIQQNWNNSTLDNNERISRDGNNIAPFNNSNYPIQGWLRMPAGSLKKN